MGNAQIYILDTGGTNESTVYHSRRNSGNHEHQSKQGVSDRAGAEQGAQINGIHHDCRKMPYPVL